jgi:hypothetical protein
MDESPDMELRSGSGPQVLGDPRPSAGPEAGRIEGIHASVPELLAIRDPAQLRAELGDRIRARPLVSVTVGVIAGFLVGRLLRD